MKLIKGTDLNESQRKQVLASFVYRTTTENNYPAHNPCNARVAAQSDADWLADHAFYFEGHKADRLSCRHPHAEPVYMADSQEPAIIGVGTLHTKEVA